MKLNEEEELTIKMYKEYNNLRITIIQEPRRDRRTFNWSKMDHVADDVRLNWVTPLQPFAGIMAQASWFETLSPSMLPYLFVGWRRMRSHCVAFVAFLLAIFLAWAALVRRGPLFDFLQGMTL